MAMRRIKDEDDHRTFADIIADYTPLEAELITDIPLEAVAPAPITQGYVRAVPQRARAKPGPKPKYEIGELYVESLTPEMVQAMLYPEPKPLTAKERKLQALVKTIPIKRDPKWDR